MKTGILKNKIFLYMTEFFAGMSVMAVELGASRLLAPYFRMTSGNPRFFKCRDESVKSNRMRK